MSKPSAIDLNDLLVFASVAEAGSFTAAAERLNTSKANISLQIRRLEAGLGIGLFHRTTRRVTLTDAGGALLALSVPHLRKALEVIDQVPSGTSELSGNLNISCTVDQAVHTVSRCLVEFSALHPKLKIDLRSSDRVVDLVRDGIDVALRVGWLRDSSLRAVKLGSFEQVVVAAPGYLQRAGIPRHPDELASHDWVSLTLLAAPLTWKFTDAESRMTTVRMNSRMRTDNPGALRGLVEAGGGVSVVDEPGARSSIREGRLIRVLPQWRLPEGGLYAVFPPGRHLPRQVQAFVDFYRARMM